MMIPGQGQPGLVNTSAGLFDVEPYRNPATTDKDGDGNPDSDGSFLGNLSDWWSTFSSGFSDFFGGNNKKSSGNEQPIVQDSGDDAISQLAKELNVKLDDTTKDYLMQYFLNEKSSQNAWSRTMDASNTQYQRAVKDLQAAGINPFLAFQSLSGSSPTSSSSGVQGGLYTSKENAKTKQDTSIVSGILGILGIIAGAIIALV